MNTDTLTEVYTFAKHMICPPYITNLTKEELADKGILDFQSYSFSQVLQKGNNKSEPSDLLDTIIGALGNELDNDKQPILLLSDGKDSMLLALALSKMNISCKTLTLLRNDDEHLKSFVKAKAIQMGHDPYFINVSSILNSYDKDTFLTACKKMSTPVLDQGFLFFIFGIKNFLNENNLNAELCQFIDGLGNDEHFGYLPSKSQLKAFRLSRYNLWKLVPNKFSWLRWYMRSPAESQGDLSAISCFFPFEKAININHYFSKIPSTTDEELIDFRAFSRGSFHDHQCMIGKTKAAAKAFGADIIYPWTNKELSTFCFNLPIDQKYEFNLLKNKVCIRNILKEELDWEQEKRGVDLFFDINESKLESMLSEFVDVSVYKRISKLGFLPNSVRKRALLELLNLCGYLSVNGYSRNDIKAFISSGAI